MISAWPPSAGSTGATAAKLPRGAAAHADAHESNEGEIKSLSSKEPSAEAVAALEDCCWPGGGGGAIDIIDIDGGIRAAAVPLAVFLLCGCCGSSIRRGCTLSKEKRAALGDKQLVDITLGRRLLQEEDILLLGGERGGGGPMEASETPVLTAESNDEDDGMCCRRGLRALFFNVALGGPSSSCF